MKSLKSMYEILKTTALILYHYSDGIITYSLEQYMFKFHEILFLKLIDFRKNYVEPIEFMKKIIMK